jgi:glutathione S-transferase
MGLRAPASDPATCYTQRVITVHHLNKSRSQRVLWLLEELEVPYELVRYERDPKTLLAPPTLAAIHPLGKSPVIVDRPSAGGAARSGEAGPFDGDVTVAESGAILEYLVERYGGGRLVPAAGTAAARDYRYFLHYAEGSLMPFLLLRLIFDRVKSAPVPFFVRPIARKIADKVTADFVAPNLTRHFAFLAQHLERHAWFAGDALTVADIQMSYPIEGAMERAKELVTPAMEAWVAKIRARPAYQRALAKG